MAETPEIPEAKDPFERRVALSIALLAAILTIFNVTGDDARLQAQLAATTGADQWTYYQAKKINEHTSLLEKDVVASLKDTVVDATRREDLLKRVDADLERYKGEQEKSNETAKKAEEARDHFVEVNDRCDRAGMILQIAIVLSSVAILVHWPILWYVGLLVGAFGAVTGASAFWLH